MFGVCALKLDVPDYVHSRCQDELCQDQACDRVKYSLESMRIELQK